MKSKRLLDALNKAYSEAEPPEEAKIRKAGKKLYADMASRKNHNLCHYR